MKPERAGAIQVQPGKGNDNVDTRMHYNSERKMALLAQVELGKQNDNVDTSTTRKGKW